MRIGDLLDPYALILKISNVESPWLAKLFGGRTELANFGDPMHTGIFREVEAWRTAWLGGDENEHRRLASYALAAGRCRDELLRRQMGPGYVRFERVFFTGAFLLTAAQIAMNSCIIALRRQHASGKRPTAVCFPANRTVRTTAARILPEAEIVYLPKYGYYFSGDALGFFLTTIWRAPALLANPRLLSNFLRLLSQFCHVAENYRPRVVIGYFDGTSSMSLLTCYLRRLGIAHYNVMHGEVFYSTDHSTYAEADRFYVWGEYYKTILLRQHCPDGQFFLLASPALTELFQRHRWRHQPRDRTLLLLHEPYLELDASIYQAMILLLGTLDDGWTVTIRTHPSYQGNLEEFIGRIRDRLPPEARRRRFVHETPFAISPPESLASHRVVASCVSTMLLEGWLAGCKVVYFSGLLRDDLLAERYQASPNVLILSAAIPAATLRTFLNTPAVLDKAETARVNHVVQVVPA